LPEASLEERLKNVDLLIDKHSELREHLLLYKAILQAQEKARKGSSKEIAINLEDQSFIEGLQQRALAVKRPIVSFLDVDTFNEAYLSETFEQVIETLIKHGVSEEELNKFSFEVKSGKTELRKLVNSVVKGNMSSLKELAERLGVRSELSLFVISMLIQPRLEEIAQRVSSSFLEKWREPYCPVCGMRPIIAKLRSRKRYLTCMLCGAEYLADLFLCVHCGNIDPYTLKFLMPEGQLEFRIDFCEKCKHYLKVIDEDNLKAPIPKGLEDILTLNLDAIAKNAGLVRS
jgi:FdhE protein